MDFLFKFDGTEIFHFSDIFMMIDCVNTFLDKTNLKKDFLFISTTILEKYDSLSIDEIEELGKFRDEQLNTNKRHS